MPPLETLKIEHYKGFFREETVEFAVPDGRTPGSGLTLIVGPNNSGKTTLLEALLLEGRVTESERHHNISPRITINDSVYSNTDGGSVIKMMDQSKPHGVEFEVVPSRRLWDHTSDAGLLGLNEFLMTTRHQDMRSTKISARTATVLKDINNDQLLKDRLHDLMAQIIPHFANWTIDSSEQGDYVKYRVGNSGHGANLLGEGVMSALHICILLLSDNNDGVLIIDEPELSLHPTAQKSLSSILRNMSKNKQIVLCTHSPYFVNWQDFLDGAHFIRLNKSKNGESTISRLSKRAKYLSFISNNLNKWQRPQLLDVAAKEILFSERVLFVEGQEDVGLIRKWARDKTISLNFDIFGYGVDGYRNILTFLQMAQDLGIEKVGALYDSGEHENVSFEKAQNRFSSFLLQKLPTDDIRDKPPKEGCFDMKGNLKVPWQEEFSGIISEFIDHFNS